MKDFKKLREEALRQQQRQAKQIRENRLRVQLEAEKRAEMYHQYAPHQRVRYHFRATDTWYDAIVVAIHFDDGPDNPYYVSR